MTNSPKPDWPQRLRLPPELIAELENAEDRYIAALDDALSKQLRTLKKEDAGHNDGGGEPG